MKLHRRRLWLDGREYTVVTLRPGTPIRFSTNFYHGTWHVLSDWAGARLLGRLLWGLAYQRVPGTIVLIDRPHLDLNPFDAEPADPIALVPALLTPFTHKAARDLRQRLPLRGAPDGTVRWHTHGLDTALAARRSLRDQPRGSWQAPWITPRGFTERVDRIGGLVTITATPDLLKETAVDVSTLVDYAYHGMAYTELNWPNGEVQVFRDYRERVSAAAVARREILSETDPGVEPRAAAKARAKAETETVPRAKAEANLRAEAGANAGTAAGTGAGTRASTRAGTKARTSSESLAGAEADATAKVPSRLDRDALNRLIWDRGTEVRRRRLRPGNQTSRLRTDA
ncbi:hypothetical protein KZZ52_34710 [Dactylosporangium sp. AC04546]|uniref:hypothetical protein n=1 Tax=Dactylosporangium sp. AC04546 TaxID=2862460 RepID=UPI001EDF0D32|nr:hypothetical protein [Dactylosporangium sp. AC04546]WVK79123.1 hypothetical protein KZZ52_34710 [Dactylosporangium sp. AC04546]